MIGLVWWICWSSGSWCYLSFCFCEQILSDHYGRTYYMTYIPKVDQFLKPLKWQIYYLKYSWLCYLMSHRYHKYWAFFCGLYLFSIRLVQANYRITFEGWIVVEIVIGVVLAFRGWHHQEASKHLAHRLEEAKEWSSLSQTHCHSLRSQSYLSFNYSKSTNLYDQSSD